MLACLLEPLISRQLFGTLSWRSLKEGWQGGRNYKVLLPIKRKYKLNCTLFLFLFFKVICINEKEYTRDKGKTMSILVIYPTFPWELKYNESKKSDKLDSLLSSNWVWFHPLYRKLLPLKSHFLSLQAFRIKHNATIFHALFEKELHLCLHHCYS